MRQILLSLLLPAAAQASIGWPFQTFRSSTFEPPNLTITKNGNTSEGYLFFDQSWHGAHDFAPFVMSDDNELIWEGRTHSVTTAVRAQELDGEPVLTYWNGSGLNDPWGFGYGSVVVLDQSYEQIYTVTLPDRSFKTINNNTPGSWIDMHEDRITDRGTMLVTAVNVTRWDLTSVGGPRNGWITNSLFYEIDIKTNEVLFRWSALDHLDQIPLRESVLELKDWGRNQTYPWGYFHINSVDPLDNGAYLISARDYCAVWQINKDGHVEWTLQGKDGGDFTLKDVSFCYQHDARLQKYTDKGLQISLFDNANSGEDKGKTPTSGLYIDIDLENHEATLLRKVQDPVDPIYSVSQGNNQLIPSNNHVIMGYGSNPKIKEFDAQGSCVMTVQFGEDGDISSYRAYRNKWVGKPKTKPAVFACNSDERTNVFMSWNGATEHQTWKVYGGADRQNLVLAGTAKKSGFETATTVEEAAYIQVEASGEGIEAKKSLVVAVESVC